MVLEVAKSKSVALACGKSFMLHRVIAEEWKGMQAVLERQDMRRCPAL